jgi:hypothetical protein
MDIVNRAKDMILKPRDTWAAIKAEQTTIKELYTSYAVILAAIPPLASFLGLSLLGVSMIGFHYRTPFGLGISHALVSYVLSLVGLYVVALIIDALAGSFGSQKNIINAMKVAVYSWTPSWVAGVLFLIPFLSPIAVLLSLYSLYLFYLGLPVLMETPKDKTMGYFIVSILISILVFIVIGFLSRSLFGLGRMGMGWM